MQIKKCEFCQSEVFSKTFSYDSPPEIETKFPIAIDKYSRAFITCETCSHMYSVHDIDLSGLYERDYNEYTYKDINGLYSTFNKIINLNSSSSDNIGRCDNLEHFISHYVSNNDRNIKILDVGSGLGVFPWEMNKRGYDITALDPDKDSFTHISENLKLKCIHIDFLDYNSDLKYDVITFNKVLEHLTDPIHMLVKSKEHLQKSGMIYIEVPDGESAKELGKDREEFLIEHYHAFSLTSLSLLATIAGFQVLSIQRLKEPSTKFTLRAFLRPNL